MPLPNSDKDVYTIDEMMDRLKRRQEAETPPELVTRSDGSHALKVKKRRRRTNQSVDKEIRLKKRIHLVQIVGAVLLLTLVLLVVGVGILHVNSSSYRESLIAKLEAASGADVAMEQFRMNPLEAIASKANFSWPGGNVLDKLDLLSITAGISPSTFLGDTFGGDEMVAVSAKLALKAADPSNSIKYVSWSAGTLPVKFSRYATSSLDIRFGGYGELSDTEGSLFPAPVAGQSELRFKGGLLKLPDWPPLTHDRSYIKVKKSELRIQNMRFSLPGTDDLKTSPGFIDFSGTLTPIGYYGTHTLSADLSNFPLSYLLGSDLGRFFVGRVDSVEIPDSNILSFDLDTPENARLELTATNALESRIDMSGFKFMQSLAVAFNDRWYEIPVFDDDVTMVIKRTGRTSSISNINLVNRGKMIVRGELFNGEGGVIKGKLRIGIPDTTVTAAGDKKLTKMFGDVREGYRWLEVEISGTGALPEDNFRTLYMDNSSQKPSATREGAPQDSFEELIKGE
jgi:hypothetical protein